MRWFQYKPGAVGETGRVTHCEAPAADDEPAHSLCRRRFDRTLIEETAEPGATPEFGQVAPAAPCIPCLLRVMAATDDGAVGDTHDDVVESEVDDDG